MIDYIISHSPYLTHCFEINPFLCRVFVLAIILLFLIPCYVLFVKFLFWVRRRFFWGC